MDEDRRTPTLDAIDDPHGIPPMVFDKPSDAAAEFVERVQSIRWDLWNLLGSLDNVEAPASATSWATLQAIDQLGIAVRAEAAHLDGFDPDPADLFTDGPMRRLRRTEEAEHELRQRREQIGAVPDPDRQDD